MRRAWVSDLEKFEKIFQSPYGVWTVCRAARGVSRVRRRTVRLTAEKIFSKSQTFGKNFQSPVDRSFAFFFFKVLDLKDNRWSPTHFSSIRRATLSRSVACEKRPGNTVPGSVKVVRGTERELKPVNPALGPATDGEPLLSSAPTSFCLHCTASRQLCESICPTAYPNKKFKPEWF